jgi:hypothetical protein
LKLKLKFAKSKQAAMSVVLVAIVSVWLVLVTSAAAQPGRDITEPGRTVFFSQGCYGCHRLGVAGTPIANDLSHVGRGVSRRAPVIRPSTTGPEPRVVGDNEMADSMLSHERESPLIFIDSEPESS